MTEPKEPTGPKDPKKPTEPEQEEFPFMVNIPKPKEKRPLSPAERSWKHYHKKKSEGLTVLKSATPSEKSEALREKKFIVKFNLGWEIKEIVVAAMNASEARDMACGKLGVYAFDDEKNFTSEQRQAIVEVIKNEAFEIVEDNAKEK